MSVQDNTFLYFNGQNLKNKYITASNSDIRDNDNINIDIAPIVGDNGAIPVDISEKARGIGFTGNIQYPNGVDLFDIIKYTKRNLKENRTGFLKESREGKKITDVTDQNVMTGPTAGGMVSTVDTQSKEKGNKFNIAFNNNGIRNSYFSDYVGTPDDATTDIVKYWQSNISGSSYLDITKTYKKISDQALIIHKGDSGDNCYIYQDIVIGDSMDVYISNVTTSQGGVLDMGVIRLSDGYYMNGYSSWTSSYYALSTLGTTASETEMRKRTFKFQSSTGIQKYRIFLKGTTANQSVVVHNIEIRKHYSSFYTSIYKDEVSIEDENKVNREAENVFSAGVTGLGILNWDNNSKYFDNSVNPSEYNQDKVYLFNNSGSNRLYLQFTNVTGDIDSGVSMDAQNHLSFTQEGGKLHILSGTTTGYARYVAFNKQGVIVNPVKTLNFIIGTGNGITDNAMLWKDWIISARVGLTRVIAYNTKTYEQAGFDVTGCSIGAIFKLKNGNIGVVGNNSTDNTVLDIYEYQINDIQNGNFDVTQIQTRQIVSETNQILLRDTVLTNTNTVQAGINSLGQVIVLYTEQLGTGRHIRGAIVDGDTFNNIVNISVSNNTTSVYTNYTSNYLSIDELDKIYISYVVISATDRQVRTKFYNSNGVYLDANTVITNTSTAGRGIAEWYTLYPQNYQTIIGVQDLSLNLSDIYQNTSYNIGLNLSSIDNVKSIKLRFLKDYDKYLEISYNLTDLLVGWNLLSFDYNENIKTGDIDLSDITTAYLIIENISDNLGYNNNNLSNFIELNEDKTINYESILSGISITNKHYEINYSRLKLNFINYTGVGESTFYYSILNDLSVTENGISKRFYTDGIAEPMLLYELKISNSGGFRGLYILNSNNNQKIEIAKNIDNTNINWADNDVIVLNEKKKEVSRNGEPIRMNGIIPSFNLGINNMEISGMPSTSGGQSMEESVDSSLLTMSLSTYYRAIKISTTTSAGYIVRLDLPLSVSGMFLPIYLFSHNSGSDEPDTLLYQYNWRINQGGSWKYNQIFPRWKIETATQYWVVVPTYWTDPQNYNGFYYDTQTTPNTKLSNELATTTPIGSVTWNGSFYTKKSTYNLYIQEYLEYNVLANINYKKIY